MRILHLDFRKKCRWSRSKTQLVSRTTPHIARSVITFGASDPEQVSAMFSKAFSRCSAVILTIFVLVVSGTLGLESAQAAGVEAAQRSVPRVVVAVPNGYGGDEVSLGTGFAIAPDVIATNRHVVEMAEGRDDAAIVVIGPRGEAQLQRAEIIMVGRFSDLALLRVPGADFVPLTLTKERVSADVRVRAIGYPGVVDRMVGANAIQPSVPEVTDGSVSSYKSISDGSQNSDGIVHTAVISQGNSGGPLIDECGRVIGVNTAIDVGRGSFAFAQGVDILAELSKEAGIQLKMVDTVCAGAMEEARQRALAEQQRQADATLAQVNELERLKAEVERREAARDAAAAAAHEATSRFNIALGGFVLVVVGVALTIALRRENWKKEIKWASAVVVLAGTVAAYWSNTTNRPPAVSSTGSGNALSGIEPVSSVAGPGGNSKVQQIEVSEQVVGSNLGGKDDALMRDPSIGVAFNCRLDSNVSRNPAATATPPDRVDMRLDLESGCLMGRTQYAFVDGRFERLTMESQTRSGIISTINPSTGQFRQRFVPFSAEEFDQIDRQRKAVRAGASCNTGQAKREAGLLEANRNLLDKAPSADLVWNCGVEKGQ